MTAGRTAIRFRQVTKTLGRGNAAVRALDGVSLDIRVGTITGLLGPNGAGKSTLLLTAVGLVRPDRGRVEIHGEPAASPRARERLGFVPEEVHHEAGFTVGEILDLHAALGGGVSRPASRACLERLGLRLPLRRRIDRCSHGTGRRLALACALVGDPRLLVLDEPTAGLDVGSRDLLLAELVRIRQDGGTVLLSSHVLAELDSVCDEVVIVKDGRVVHSGPAIDSDEAGAVALRVEGLTGPRLRALLGTGWVLREDAVGVCAVGTLDGEGAAVLVAGVERLGGRVVELREAGRLSDVYRGKIER